MYQYDDPTVAAEMPAITDAGTPGFFTDGDPQTSKPRTVLKSEFMNTVMMEMLNVLAAGAVTPDKTKQNQLALAIANMISAAVTAAAAPEPGDIKIWAGTVAAIPARFGPGWYLANGQNGTINMTDKFIVGAGNTYAVGATGGSSSVTLTVDQLPPHGHVVDDPGHEHPITDPGHEHPIDVASGDGANGNINLNGGTPGSKNTNAATTGISVNSAQTGITLQSTGSGQSIDIRPLYYAVCFVQYVGA